MKALFEMQKNAYIHYQFRQFFGPPIKLYCIETLIVVVSAPFRDHFISTHRCERVSEYSFCLY